MPTEEPPTPWLAPPPFEQTIVHSDNECGGLGHACCARVVVLEAERERLRAGIVEIEAMAAGKETSTWAREHVLIAARALLAGMARPRDPLSEEEREGLAFVRRYSENGHCNGREERLLTIIDKLLTALGLAIFNETNEKENP